MEVTGERLIPDKMPERVASHEARYIFALPYIEKGNRVLDVGCGVGYGSVILAKRAGEVYAFDKDKESIEYAKKYYARDNIEYIQHEFNKDNLLPYEPYFFNTIIAFEVLEHLKDDKEFLSNIYKLLKGSGTFICSTPIGWDIPRHNPFHIREYSVGEFIRLLNDAKFRITAFKGQANEKISEFIHPRGYQIAVCK